MKTVALARRTNVLRDFQNLKMARSPHAFIRGTTAQFYRWLDEPKKGTLPEGPAIWICGDCHVSSATLTTTAFDRSSLRWLGIGS
jgi:uncharacterized protein (DUF2252 family)